MRLLWRAAALHIFLQLASTHCQAEDSSHCQAEEDSERGENSLSCTLCMVSPLTNCIIGDFSWGLPKFHFPGRTGDSWRVCCYHCCSSGFECCRFAAYICSFDIDIPFRVRHMEDRKPLRTTWNPQSQIFTDWVWLLLEQCFGWSLTWSFLAQALLAGVWQLDQLLRGCRQHL